MRANVSSSFSGSGGEAGTGLLGLNAGAQVRRLDEFYDGGSRGMCVEIQLQEFEKYFGIEHGQRKRQLAGESV